MATKPSLSGILEDQLTCPVCLERYTNPKILPCHHSFCEHCLEGLPLDKKNETYYLSCPTCRQQTELPEEGVGAFPAAFTLNNFKDMHSLIKKVPKCHHKKPLELFCATCDAVICSICLVHDHNHHNIELINDSYAKHCQELEECLSPLEERKEALKKVISSLTEREGDIRQRGQGVLEEIHKMVEEMMNALHQSERKLTEQVKRVTDAKVKVLSEQIKAAEKCLSLLEEVEDDVQQRLKTGSPQQVLGSKKQMKERMSEVTAGINVEELKPKEKPDFALSKDIKSLHHIGDIVTYSSTALQQCRVKKVGSFQRFPKLETFSFSLSIEASDSSLLSVPLSSLKCSLVLVGKGDQPIHTTVTTSTDPGVYRIQCSPSTSGTHILKVQVYDVQLKDTSLVIPFNPYLDNITPVHTIPEINHPWGVVASDSHVIVTEFDGKCVTMLDREGKKVKSLEGSGNAKPRGLAITADKFILLSDKDEIQKIDMGGCHIASVGGRGAEPLQFHFPA
ncbi:PREDICTED: tripartite motif containing 13-like, partial [Amphimedon queenslandica]|uniref:RING-type domain-containing protein n=3 Tax=Amphimedon queenslandica TaxID=400682 RepID=A0AAN0K0G9_AMPQE